MTMIDNLLRLINRKRLLLACCPLAGTLAITGCGGQSEALPASTAPPAMAIGHASCEPVRIGVFDDRSVSMDGQNEPLKAADLEPLIELVQRCTGVLGLGVIGENSNIGLARFPVYPAPDRPTKPNIAGGPFDNEVITALNAYQTQLDEYDRVMTGREQRMAADLQSFRQAAKQLLDRPATERATDIYGALYRLDRFLGEPDHAFGGRTRRVGMLVTDGRNTVRRAARPFQSGDAELLVVHGSPDESGFPTELNPVFFENPRAAIDHIIRSQGGRPE